MAEGKKIILTKEQLMNAFNVEFVNCNNFSGKIFKYMPLSRVMQLLQERKLAFAYPELWEDPYETKYLKTDYSAVGYTPKKVFCLCARRNNENEEASWKIYADTNSKDPVIRVTIDTFKLLEYLRTYTTENNCKLYVSNINYDYTKAEIDSICKNGTPLYDKYINGMNEQKYIQLMSLKRRAFKYESERRFFIVPQHNGQIADDLLKVDIGFDMLVNFVINPCERIKNENDILSKLKLEQYNSTVKCIKDEIKKINPNAKVTVSKLYSNIQPVEKI